jgi:hypothetical protein
MERSPRALARARRPLIAVTRITDAAMPSHAGPGHTKRAPPTAKTTSQPVNATACVHATMTSGGMARARPLRTANWVAWVTAAASARTNQLRGAS